jgi:transcriptional regulator with XRE-family HTH domain
MPATKPRHLRDKQSVAFADLIVTARQHAGLTQQTLAELAGTDRSTIIRWESGDACKPDASPLRATCDALGIRYTDALIALGTLTAADLAPAA